ncbi:hypothetical protein MRB53_040105 [Persea americana]|nr:hypothetical protein MRB53_040105 [Persea americana]
MGSLFAPPCRSIAPVQASQGRLRRIHSFQCLAAYCGLVATNAILRTPPRLLRDIDQLSSQMRSGEHCGRVLLLLASRPQMTGSLAQMNKRRMVRRACHTYEGD